MNQKQVGFTLIELIAVIVILGILAATAVPRFVDLQDAADQAALDGVAGALGSASALNFAADIAQDAGVAGGTAPIDQSTCGDTPALLVPANVLPNGYTIQNAATALDADGETCTVGDGTLDSDFTAYAADST